MPRWISGDPRDAVNTENPFSRSHVLGRPRPSDQHPHGPISHLVHLLHPTVPFRHPSPSVRVSFGRSPSSPTAAYLSESPFQGSGVPATPPPTPPPKSILKPVRRPSNSGSIRGPMGARGRVIMGCGLRTSSTCRWFMRLRHHKSALIFLDPLLIHHLYTYLLIFSIFDLLFDLT